MPLKGGGAQSPLLIETVNNMSNDKGVSLKDMQAQLAALAEQNAKLMEALAAKKQRTMSFKVGEKGNLCIYGLQRFPFSFYRQQIETILDNADAIRAFIKANGEKLTVKE